MKKFQIRTYGDPFLAKAIQYKLFELGYSWEDDSGKDVRHHDAASCQVGLMGEGTMTCSYSGFLLDGGELISIDELFLMKPEVKETIKIGTQTYDKSDFEAATKHLTPIK